MTAFTGDLAKQAVVTIEQSLGTPDCRKFRRRIFNRFPLVADDLRRGFVDEASCHLNRPRGNTAGNIWLRMMRSVLMLGPWNVCHDDDALVEYARAKADSIADRVSRAERQAATSRVAEIRSRLWAMPTDAGTPFTGLTFRRVTLTSQADTELAVLRDALTMAHAHHLDIAPPVELERLTFVQRRILLRKLGAAAWWRRKLRAQSSRRLEQFMRLVRRVHKRAGVYVSDIGHGRYRAREAANAGMLDSTTAVNQFEQEYTLAELAAGSVADRDIRFAEMMLRVRDTEAYANRAGHHGVFITWTLASQYHAVLQKTCEHNPKYNGATPRQAQARFQELWSRARAKLARKKIRFYGLRVVEPHHDGTPHWHQLLWVAPADLPALTAVLKEYALADDPDEVAGREQVRFRVEPIDPSKGSAAGYVVKYIAKNLNSAQAGGVDHYGQPLSDAAPRIAAWASTWGIRQFQFLGLPSVTVWRELRRMRNAEDNPYAAECLDGWEAATRPDPEALAILHDLRRAANSSNWEKFLELNGGPCVPLIDRPVRPWRLIRQDPQAQPVNQRTGDIRFDIDKLGAYGEPVAATLGVTVQSLTGEASFLSRYYRWEVRPAGVGGQRSGAAAKPWTRVNNCTDAEKGRIPQRLLTPQNPLPKQPYEQVLADQVKRYSAWRASAEFRAEMESVEIENQLAVSLRKPKVATGWEGIEEYFPPELGDFETPKPIQPVPTVPQGTDDTRAVWQLLTSCADAERRRALRIDDEQALRLAASLFQPPQEERSTWASLMYGINRKRMTIGGKPMSSSMALSAAAALWGNPAPADTPSPTQA